MGSDTTAPGIGSADALPILAARRTLAQHGQSDAVAVMDGHLRQSKSPATVVVVGEVKRGKSTLVNALTGALVSPSSADLAATAVVAVVPPGPALSAGQPNS